MLSRLLSLTLVVAVLDCPMLCGPATTVRADDSSAAGCSGCCHHHQAPAPAEEDSAPAAPTHDGDAVCQCICNGAVVDHAAVQPVGVDLDNWAPVAVTPSLVTTSSGRLSLLQAVHQPDDGMNPGRALRCLYMTYLC
jgi:hypothetical protein